MKVVAYAIAILVGFLGTMFLIGAQGQVIRHLVGNVLIMGAIAIFYLSRIEPRISSTTTIQKIDFGGDINLEEIRCQSCNAPLANDDLEVKAGAIFVEYGHCGETYQIEEESKW